ncbi:hypothetical protein [Limosilactobacillus equigenerosi]|uniref:Uncharacterized protein n=1 Tax=Limosilactobacillus equigenerosi DSM 18793 = JCM 14505 TaxID=1423742 RepID=A0A0R1UHY2_9LACO|nr:hypothetical protein [Limosilactobacillus equigenerosi]KRL92516.1 hypothetical protein FC21_GL000236 [Limosilactobacillus equigenerosi DSM 18793 = JCM 14505]
MIKENTPYRVKPLYQINWRYYIVKIKDEYFVIDYINPRNIFNMFLYAGKRSYMVYKIGKTLDEFPLEYTKLNWVILNCKKFEVILTVFFVMGIILSFVSGTSNILIKNIPLILDLEIASLLILYLISLCKDKYENFKYLTQYKGVRLIYKREKYKSKLGAFLYCYITNPIGECATLCFLTWLLYDTSSLLILLMVQLPGSLFIICRPYINITYELSSSKLNLERIPDE